MAACFSRTIDEDKRARFVAQYPVTHLHDDQQWKMTMLIIIIDLPRFSLALEEEEEWSISGTLVTNVISIIDAIKQTKDEKTIDRPMVEMRSIFFFLSRRRRRLIV